MRHRRLQPATLQLSRAPRANHRTFGSLRAHEPGDYHICLRAAGAPAGRAARVRPAAKDKHWLSGLRRQQHVELNSNFVFRPDARHSGRFDPEVGKFHGRVAGVVAVLQSHSHGDWPRLPAQR